MAARTADPMAGSTADQKAAPSVGSMDPLSVVRTVASTAGLKDALKAALKAGPTAGPMVVPTADVSVGPLVVPKVDSKDSPSAVQMAALWADSLAALTACLRVVLMVGSTVGPMVDLKVGLWAVLKVVRSEWKMVAQMADYSVDVRARQSADWMAGLLADLKADLKADWSVDLKADWSAGCSAWRTVDMSADM